MPKLPAPGVSPAIGLDQSEADADAEHAEQELDRHRNDDAGEDRRPGDALNGGALQLAGRGRRWAAALHITRSHEHLPLF